MAYGLTVYSLFHIYENMNMKMAKQVDKMRGQAAMAEEMLKALANRHRLLILCQLNGGETPVGELATMLGVRESTVSQHLALLRKDELVSTRREGQTIWYSLASEPVRRLVGTLYEIYCGPQAICGPARRARKGSPK
jgi:DNA-binding transcriptional ArsR family regulator